MTQPVRRPKSPSEEDAAAHAFFLQKLKPGPRRLSLANVAELYGNDFPGFCSLLEIVPKSGPRVPFVFNAVQRHYLAEKTLRDIILKGRQVGITTLEQARDIWFMLTRQGARVVATCQSITDHGPLQLLSKNYRVFFESLRKNGVDLSFHTEAAGRWAIAESDATLTIIEAGASEAAASKKGRAGTITRLHLTETAFYEYAEETLNALLECVPDEAQGTEIVSESTPNGASGTFFEQCESAKKGASGYAFHFLPWYLHREEYRAALDPGEVIEPQTDRERYLVRHGVDQEQIKWYRRKVEDKGQDRTDQEYPSDPATCFLVAGRLFFDRVKTNAMITNARDPVEVSMGGALRIWTLPKQDGQYLIAGDTSEGVGGDAGAGIVLDRDTWEHVATLWGQFRPWDLAKALAEVGRLYNEAMIAVERNNHGHAVLRALDVEQHYGNLFHDHDDRPGWISSQQSRTPALEAMFNAHFHGQFVSNDVELGAEMLRFIVLVNGRAEAAKGAHDDLVIATAIVRDVASRMPPVDARIIRIKSRRQ